MAMVVFFEAVPPRWYGEGGGVLTGFIALATLVGPLLGGVISERTTWRWIFLLK
jgi:MFS family permease